MSLPPLPKELAAFAETQARHCALNDMVQAYGQVCYEKALLDAMNKTLPYSATGAVRATAIRSLK